MKNSLLLFLLSFLFFACNERQVNLEPINKAKSDEILSIDDKVEKRLNFINRNLSKEGPHVKLAETQKTALRSVIKQKMMAIESANLYRINPKSKRKAVRDSIRNAWQGDIDAILRSDQIEVRKNGFGTSKKDKS